MSRTQLKEIDTPAWKIFHEAYMCRIPAAFVRSEADVNRYGTVTTGDRAFDMEMAEELVTCGKTIAVMAKLHSQAVDIILLNYKDDARRIYEMIETHCKDIAHRINVEYASSPVVPDTDRIDTLIADVRILEEFGDAIYPMAKANIPSHLRGTTVADMLAQFNAGFQNVGTTVQEVAPVPFEESDKIDNLVSQKVVERIKAWQR